MYRLLGIIVLLAFFTGCAYERAVNNLSPDERTAFQAYRKVMYNSQKRAYLGKASEGERSAYLRQIGVQQRFNALDAQDRESVLNGFIRTGMSAEALRFLWGMPEHAFGPEGKWEYWLYRGFAGDLFEKGNQPWEGSTQVRVFLVDDQVEWWSEEVPEGDHDQSDRDIMRR